tara:strand:+ start:1503 stop:2387 length:885 start_codon:yes stop_codon:yes gene_type:complete
MSEEVSNTAVVGEVAEPTTTAETEATQAEPTLTDIDAAVDEGKKFTKDNKGQNKGQRQVDALNQAKLQQMKIQQQASLEEVADIDLPTGKGVNFKTVVEALPEDAKTLIGNLRADYTRKTQELANQRKELEARMAALTESGVYDQVKELANREPVELDPYDTKSFEDRIEQEVSKRMEQLLKPIAEQQELQARQYKLQEFKTKHPDLEDMKVEVAEELQRNHHLALEDAYYIVKGRKNAQELQALREENAHRKEQMRNAGLKIGTPRDFNPNRPPPNLKKGHEIYDWLKRNGKR